MILPKIRPQMMCPACAIWQPVQKLILTPIPCLVLGLVTGGGAKERAFASDCVVGTGRQDVSPDPKLLDPGKILPEWIHPTPHPQVACSRIGRECTGWEWPLQSRPWCKSRTKKSLSAKATLHAPLSSTRRKTNDSLDPRRVVMQPKSTDPDSTENGW